MAYVMVMPMEGSGILGASLSLPLFISPSPSLALLRPSLSPSRFLPPSLSLPLPPSLSLPLSPSLPCSLSVPPSLPPLLARYLSLSLSLSLSRSLSLSLSLSLSIPLSGLADGLSCAILLEVTFAVLYGDRLHVHKAEAPGLSSGRSKRLYFRLSTAPILCCFVQESCAAQDGCTLFLSLDKCRCTPQALGSLYIVRGILINISISGRRHRVHHHRQKRRHSCFFHSYRHYSFSSRYHHPRRTSARQLAQSMI